MRYGALCFFILLFFSSCERYMYGDRMLRIDPAYAYSEFSDITETEYRIAPDDRISARLFTNDGSGLVNIGTSGNISVGGSTDLNIKIESDGFAKLPIFGRVYLQGLTIRQAEMLIEDKFSEFYNNPFVLLEVSNRRVMIFAGSNTTVVTLTNDNTTLFEVLAESGGMPEDGKASKIKLIRGSLKNPDVYRIDLSTLSGMKDANLVMQANDIIYIETRRRYVTKAVSELAPYLAILTSIVSTTAIILQLQRLGGQ